MIFVKKGSINLIALLLLTLISCTHIDLFEQNFTIPKYEWRGNFAITGNFIITDTIPFYHIYLVIRHTDAYRYNNLWLNVGIQAPGESMQLHKMDIQLGDDASGWKGIGLNDIWEVRESIYKFPKNLKAGFYTFKILQIMRDNPLENIMSIGLRVEKSKP